MELKLIGANVCPFVHRVRLSLAEKGLEHEYLAVDLRNKPDWYYEVLPTGKVPFLEHGEARVWESHIICEYLEDAFPQHPLLPDSAALRAEVRLLISQEVGAFVSCFYRLLSSQEADAQDKARTDLQELFQKLEAQLEWYGGDYFFPELSLADLELYPWFERWCVIEHYRGLAIPKDLAALQGWIRSMQKRKSVERLREDGDFFIEQYRDYAVGSIVPS